MTTVHATPALDEVIARMDARLNELTSETDGRRRFLRMYGIFKKALRRSLADGAFLDTSWSEAICCRMAELYFEADHAYEHNPAACPESWTYCFDLAREGRANLLQDMLLGMNAHINFDLPLATHDTLLAFGDLSESSKAASAAREVQLAFDANLRRRYFDFLQINQVAWQTIPEIQDAMTSDFSHLLGLANVASFRYSRRVVEKLIVDHRDRAWAHTLLIALADDEDEVASVISFISEFAMGAAALVDRLTLNPFRLAQALRRRSAGRSVLARQAAHVRLLVEHLRRPLTARVARRALIEYGSAIHPILEEALAEAATDRELRDAILSILAASPSPEVAKMIARHASATSPDSGHAAIGLLASLRRAGVAFDLPEAWLRQALEREAQRERRLRECARDLGAAGDDGLLRDALETRLQKSKHAMLEILTILHPHSTLPASPERIMLNGDVHADPVRGTVAARLEELARTSDPWLQACALHRIGELRLLDLAPLVESRTSSESDLVRETALHVRRERLQPPDQQGRSPMLSIIEKVLYLKNVELFQKIASEDLAEVARVAMVRRFERGDELIREGAPGDELYVIVEGAVDVVARGDRRLARLGEGSVIGEMAILSEAPTSAACVAATRGRALRIRRDEFLGFLLDYPDISIGLIEVLAARLRDTSAQVPAS